MPDAELQLRNYVKDLPETRGDSGPIFIPHELPSYWGEFGNGEQRGVVNPYISPALPPVAPERGQSIPHFFVLSPWDLLPGKGSLSSR
jgi:hypothetical protein